MNISPQDRTVLRDLARRVAQAAADDSQAVIRQRWQDVNGLRRPDRAPVWCRPVGCWKEIIPPEQFQCIGEQARALEEQFRRILFKADLGDDEIIPAEYIVPAVIAVDPPSRFGVEIGQHRPDSADGAWKYDPPLKSQADFDRLVMPSFRYDAETSQRNAEAFDDLLGDILPVRLALPVPYDSATFICNQLAYLRGLEQIMMDMIDAPELVHRLAGYLRDVRQAELDFWESTGLIEPNTNAPMLASDPLGPQNDGPKTLANCFCSGNSQEFDPVSPAMVEEFLLAYQKPIFERFALSCYGCCENLTQKIDTVLKIPNLRIFVCSAWTDLNVLLEKLPAEKYCIMWRQKATDVVFPDDLATIAADLDTGCRALQGRSYQIVLRELQTLAGHPNRLQDWTRLAIEAAERYA